MDRGILPAEALYFHSGDSLLSEFTGCSCWLWKIFQQAPLTEVDHWIDFCLEGVATHGAKIGWSLLNWVDFHSSMASLGESVLISSLAPFICSHQGRTSLHSELPDLVSRFHGVGVAALEENLY